MKAKICITFVVSLLLFYSSVYAQDIKKTVTRAESKIFGDLNEDGKVDAADVVTLVDLIMKGEGDSEEDTDITDDWELAKQELAELKKKLDHLPLDDSYDEKQIIKTKYEELAAAFSEHTVDIEKLKEYILNTKVIIDKLNKTAVTAVTIQQTLDCVVGTINLPGFNPGFLASYVGVNYSGMPEFPIASEDYNVEPDGKYLKNREINVEPIWNSGKKSYLVDGIGNAGKLYFTMNPHKTIPSLMQFDLINSTGQVSPITLSDIKESDDVIQFALSRQGDVQTGTKNKITYLYEAKATIGIEDVEKSYSDWSKFGYSNLWEACPDAVLLTSDHDEYDKCMLGHFNKLINYYMGDDKKDAQTFNGILDSSLKIIEDFYNGIYQQREKLQKQALRASWYYGCNDVISDFDITTVIINPLNWKQMYWLDTSNPSWNVGRCPDIVNEVVVMVQSAMPAIDKVTLSTENTTGTTRIVVNDTNNKLIGYVDVESDAKDLIVSKIQIIANEVNKILMPYSVINSTDNSNIMSRVNSYLNKGTDRFYNLLEKNPAYGLTEPMLLFESADGIGRLEANMKIKANNQPVTFVMTSLTEEYIVPIYKKYVALLVGGNVQQSYLLSGREKVITLNIPDEPCEIVYQASDFYGNVVTKRYPINQN